MSGFDPLSIRQVAVFAALVDQGSFTKAAQRLGVSQSTVSGHIADLERRLGLRLVGRERAGARPTAAGQAFLPAARQVLRAEAHARQMVAELHGLVRGTLVVGASTIPADHLLPGMLARFRAEHAEIVLDVRAGDSAQVLDRVQAGELDLGLVGATPPKALRAWSVGEDRLVLVTPPGHPLAEHQEVALTDLLETPLVAREVGSGTQAAAEAALAEAVPKARFDIVCRMGSTSAIKQAVRAGLGVAFVSALAVEDERQAGQLAVCRVPELDRPRTFHLVAKSERGLSPAARAFVAMTTD